MLLNCGVGDDSRIPWTTRRSNHSILKEINSEYSLERLLLKLKLQHIGHLVWRDDYWKRLGFWERLKAEEEEGNREWDGWMASPTWWTWIWTNSGRWWRTEEPGVLPSTRSQRIGQDWATEYQQQNKNWQAHALGLSLSEIAHSLAGVYFFLNPLLSCQLWTGTCQEHLAETEQQGRLSSASLETQPRAAAVADLQFPGGEFRVEWGTLCSRESGGTGLYIVR